ncbi:hypothetical protein V6N13_076983 [Hibiscus sabdariffa]
MKNQATLRREKTDLTTLETRGKCLGADVEQQAEGKWDIKVDAQNVSFDSSAKAKSSLKISKALDEGAAWLNGRGTKGEVEQPTEKISTYT